MAVNVVACILLLVEYLLGMAVNLYVILPGPASRRGRRPTISPARPSALDWVISDGPGWAAAHAAFGLALVLAAFASVALPRRQDGRAGPGDLGARRAGHRGRRFNGVSFLDYGHALSSMIMAGLRALALACYITGLFLCARRARPRR